MIYTVTFNPAIDYMVRTEGIKHGSVNRAVSEEMYFGGKGINVSAVLAELGVKSRALGFIAGFTGEAIERGVKDMGIE
ncbi:MAG: 1-phosphofructokinase, partial [Alphaproteobacteria bacterium]|nr:1-phosphofructokinase [Alphaproteobacteria bacterium]